MSYVLTPLTDAIIQHGALTVLTDFTGLAREEGNASLRLIQMLEAAFVDAPTDQTVAILFATASTDVMNICHDTVENHLCETRRLTMMRLNDPSRPVAVAADLINYLDHSTDGRKFNAIYVDGGSLTFTDVADWAMLATELRELGSRHEAYVVLSRWQLKLPDVEPEPEVVPE